MHPSATNLAEKRRCRTKPFILSPLHDLFSNQVAKLVHERRAAERLLLHAAQPAAAAEPAAIAVAR